jgi:hypothetical protein
MTIESTHRNRSAACGADFGAADWGNIDELPINPPGGPPGVAVALNSPPFRHSELFIPERSREQIRPAELHGRLIAATRNVGDFEGTGVRILNPWGQ